MIETRYQVGDSLAIEPAGCLKVPVDDVYAIGDKINAGAFSTVYKAYHLSNPDVTFAVKVLYQDTEDDEAIVLREVSIMRDLKNVPNVIQLTDFYMYNRDMYIFQSYAEGGDVLDRLTEKMTYEEKAAREISRNLFTTIQSIHQRNIVHRDLKFENILLKDKNDDTQIMLCDFGCAIALPEHGGLRTLCGTPAYTAPEIVLGQEYGKEVDMWSLGCIIYSLLSGSLPFGSDDIDECALYERACKADYDFDEEVWDFVSGSVKNLISNLLHLDTNQRLTADQALGCTWITKSKRTKSFSAPKKKFSLKVKRECGREGKNNGSVITRRTFTRNSKIQKIGLSSLGRSDVQKYIEDEDNTSITAELDDSFFDLTVSSDDSYSSVTRRQDLTEQLENEINENSVCSLKTRRISYSLEELRNKSIPGLDYKKSQKYLSDEDFGKVFNASRDEVATWKEWKITNHKLRANIF